MLFLKKINPLMEKSVLPMILLILKNPDHKKGDIQKMRREMKLSYHL